MAYLLATNPDTFEIMVENNIKLFHGTNANALPSILNYGMKSIDELSEMGIVASTGEQWSRIQGKRNFVSFTDNIDTAIDYSLLNPKNNNKQKTSFGMLIGISKDDIKQMRTYRIHSDTPEIGIKDVPLEYIKMIAVPQSKVKFVSKLLKNESIIVTPIDIDDRFYYMDESEILFDEEKAKKIAERRKQTEQNFDVKQIKELAHERVKSGIINIYGKLKTMINSKGKNKENDSKYK